MLKFHLFVIIVVLINDIKINCINWSTRGPRNKRITGGDETNITYHPFMVSVQRFNGLTCGGTLIHIKWVLTAAHCIWEFNLGKPSSPRSFIVIAGDSYWWETSNTTHKQIKTVDGIRVHPNFSLDKVFNDIGMMKLSTPVRITKYVQLVMISRRPPVPIDITETVVNECYALGWGKQYRIGKYSKVLKIVQLEVISNFLCQAMTLSVQKALIIQDTNICTYGFGGGRDFCKADSGGPLICNNSQVGIVCLNFGCGRLNSPSVWTRVDKYVDWINETAHSKQMKIFVFKLYIYLQLVMYFVACMV